MKKPGTLLAVAAILFVAGCGATANMNAPNLNAPSETPKAASPVSGQDHPFRSTDQPQPQAVLPFSPIKPILTALPLFPW